MTSSNSTKRDVAILIGNGVSVAANPELMMAKLTSAIIEQFNKAAGGGTDAGQVLANLVDDMPKDDATGDFEALLAPLDRIGAQLLELGQLAAVSAGTSDEVLQHIKGVTSFLESARRLGVGHALEVIDERAYASQTASAPIRDFLDAALRVGRRGCARAVVANLNYDSLAHAVLINLVSHVDLCDMADGRLRATLDVLGSGEPVSGLALRDASGLTSSWVANRRVVLLHPHGSVAWVKQPGTGRVYSVAMEDLRGEALVGKPSFWEAYRANLTDWEPVVVLANQSTKGDLVEHQPFAPAYDAFYSELLTADRWLLAGYSFRDGCINDVLARAWAKRQHKPKVMVVVHGDGVTDEAILDALSYDPAWDALPSLSLTILREGIELAPSTSRWEDWAE